jgi:hypothetical protein
MPYRFSKGGSDGTISFIRRFFVNREMCNMLEALRLKGIVKPGRELELPELPPDLPEGEVEVILLYEKRAKEGITPLFPLKWPALNGGRYLGGALRREELYDDDGR